MSQVSGVPEPRSTALPQALGNALRYGPFHRALAEAIEHRGLSLSRLRAHLAARDIAIAESTLSYWQRGLRHPSVPRSLAVVRALEQVLRLPDDSLVVLLGPRRRAPEVSEHRPAISELSQSWAETCTLLDEFTGVSGVPCNSDLDLATVIDALRLTAEGGIGELTSTMVVRARRPGPDGFVVTHQAEPGTEAEVPQAFAVDGCRLGRVRRHPSSAGMVFEALFDRRLDEGDTHVFTFRVTLAKSLRSTSFHRTIRGRMSAYLLRMRCDPAALPVRCTRVVREREGLDPIVSESLLCGHGGVVSAYFENLGPGVAGIDLIWD
ncbi:helix-turn-helix domain-containing protein [Amycolatopsis anabasis]|uniref:helix-turn-helix domain-containing protein n=1 Tax=Amycolatopsis anabasis TaxID=1840409 RepID=UPI001FE795BD|nr:helix-turn-helix transcriptional regulator [Amycolatopsis anabasis]